MSESRYTYQNGIGAVRCDARILSLCLTLLCLGCEADSSALITPSDAPRIGKADYIQPCSYDTVPSCVSFCGTGTWVEPECTNTGWRCRDSVDVSYCPDFADYCVPDEPCGAGYTCVKSVTYPVPVDDEPGICRKGAITRRPDVEACRPDGTLDAAAFVSSHAENTGQIVKIAGELTVQMSCSSFACADDDPCCNTCLGNYVVELRDPANQKQWVDLVIDVGAPGCSGTTCDTSCGPLQPGDTYTIWGVLDSCQGLHRCTLLAMGSCPF